MNPEENLTVILIGTDISSDTAYAQMTKALVEHLKSYHITVNRVPDLEGLQFGPVAIGTGFDCVVVAWDPEKTPEIVSLLRSRHENIPIFLMTEPEVLSHIPVEIVKEVNEYIWILGDTSEFIAGRIDAAAKRYRATLLPPMFSELVHFSEDHEYSWHTPGHTGGTAFLKSPIGRLFHEFFGEELFRSDLSISVGELGSLLDHSGPIGKAEEYAAQVFGADRTYFVTNGTSTSNRIIHTAMVTRDDIVLVDRNCHKSIEHAITMNHGTPVYMIPSRNRYGILGPIYPKEMEPEEIKRKISSNPLVADHGCKPRIAVVTNSTYDGLCYDAKGVETYLGASVDNIHFDEAWYGYARFNPIYSGRFGMREESKGDLSAPTVFATQSTHKLLAAFSQASMLHVREGRTQVEKDLFNEAFMMHASTSPFYPIIASLDVSSKMMDDGGHLLTRESIDEAIRFRQMMARISSTIKEDNPSDWWFEVWQPESIQLPGEKEKTPFKDVPPVELATNPSNWTLHPGESWHGFKDIPKDWAMLDPIKVTVLCPGINADESFEDFGIPAALVVKFLDTKGIINEKSGDYNILFLFSMGITNGKWGTLVSEFFEFKRQFEENVPVKEIFLDLVENWPQRYQDLTIQELADQMHQYIAGNNQTILGNQACAILPCPVMTPAEAYRHLVRGEVESIPVSDMENRVVATGVVPYPPGIPVLMPGENAGLNTEPILSYLRTLEEFDRQFPGFSHDIHGVEVKDGQYHIYCIREDVL
ncbi:Orn/Lys/Arg decarboxylase N-terminal domain-containing protein [Methanospirillum stamsii]|uniref:Arginine decarboxylase n=1 Tax=Methanospirillum stamsii TaxID=1277351 RepID=A0A2V2NBL7_9EURY|nr:Orn/Lys/Arg decarboxylase N-terminal domain-containing protein [Methanospirillum stamsii]PWR72971.1 arginine decarboxylase [Methanospirillum stamsii]